MLGEDSAAEDTDMLDAEQPQVLTSSTLSSHREPPIRKFISGSSVALVTVEAESAIQKEEH